MKKLIAILLALTLLTSCGESEPEVDPVPNEQFGMVEEVYSSGDTLPPEGVVSTGDSFSVDRIHTTLKYSNDLFAAYMKHNPFNRIQSALVLRLDISATDDLAHTRLMYEDDRRLSEFLLDDNERGYVEKLDENGEWTVVHSLTLIPMRRKDVNVPIEFIALPEGEQTATVSFPIHEPGTYRLTYCFRDFSFDGFDVTTDEKLQTYSHIYTIPEPSEKKFDVVAVELSGSTAAVLCRTNDGSIPYQDMSATTLEVQTPDGWQTAYFLDGTPAASLLYDYELEHPDIAPAAYTVEHPFTGETVENLFAGTAKFRLGDNPDDALYRLTLEFVENADGSGERYVLHLNLDLSEED